MTTPTPIDLIWEAHQDEGPQTALEAELYQAAKRLERDLAAAQEEAAKYENLYGCAMAELQKAQEARQAAEALERERAAKVCEDEGKHFTKDNYGRGYLRGTVCCAAAIRGRP